jgi:hypothetical protein
MGSMRVAAVAALCCCTVDPLSAKKPGKQRLSPRPSKIVKLSDVVIADQHTCSRSGSLAGDEPMIVDSHLSLSSRL